MINNIWNEASLEQLQWVEKFKKIFINNQRQFVHEIFDRENFWQHNGFTMDEYCDYEFEEFSLKCKKFDLTMEASIECYQLKDNFFYFSLGKKEDKAVFEAIFKWNNQNHLVIGNGYYFKIEPKTQFIKNLNHEHKTLRRINITPKSEIQIHAIVQKEPGEDVVFNKIILPPHLGGNFYNIQYQREEEINDSFWDNIKVATNNGIINQSVLMRGKDHPLFIPNLYPNIINNKQSVIIEKNIFPVVLYVLFEDNSELYFKYPLNNEWHFDKNIKTVCLTDTLSFDWIITN